MVDAERGTAGLLERARGGDRGAAEALFEGAAERLATYVRARLGPELGAQVELADVLQETYAQALKDLVRFQDRGPGSFAAWLCRVAERRLLDLAKHGRAARRRPPGNVLPAEVLLERARRSEAGPRTAAERGERDERLRAALTNLEPEQRAAVLDRHFLDLSLEEVARRAGRSVAATRRLLARGLANLGAALDAGDGA